MLTPDTRVVRTTFAGGVNPWLPVAPAPDAKKPKGPVYIPRVISPAQQRVLNQITRDGPIARTTIRDELNTCWSTVKRSINKLLDEGMIEAVQVGKIQKYRVKSGQTGQCPSA